MCSASLVFTSTRLLPVLPVPPAVVPPPPLAGHPLSSAPCSNFSAHALPQHLQIGTVQLQQRPRAGGFSQTLPAAPDQPVKVSLHDCLACSGCVTSAETVLLQHQSTGELMQRLADRANWTVVLSLSPQSVASLAALYGLSVAECGARLAAFLRQLGVRAVFDAAAARQLSLAEAAAEFVQRFRATPRGAATLAAAGRSAPLATSAAVAAAAAGSSDAMDVDGPPMPSPADAVFGVGPSGGSGSSSSGGPLPMLASACPGWVCYAEKTHGDHVLPYISTGEGVGRRRDGE